MTEAFAPTIRDLQAWRRLVKHARRCAADPTAPAGDLRAAASARNVVCPSATARDAICIPLRRLGGAWPAMNDATRRANADKLAWLAEALAPLVEALDAKPVTASEVRSMQARTAQRQRGLGLHIPAERDDPRPERRPRLDLEG